MRKVGQAYAAEIELGIFDIEKYRSSIGQRRQRSPSLASPTGDMTVQAFGEGPWYERKKAKSETKAREYLGDLRIISSIKIDDKRTAFGTLKLRDLKPEHIDQLTNELKKRQGRKRDVIGETRLNTLLRKVARSILDLAYERGYITEKSSWLVSEPARREA